MDIYQKLVEATSFLKPFVINNPTIAVVLGSGLSNFIKELEVEKEIEYDAIPHFPVSTVEGHHGKLIFWFYSRQGYNCNGRAFAFL